MEIVVRDVTFLNTLRAKKLLGPLFERVDNKLMLLALSVRRQEWFSNIRQVFANISVGLIRITAVFSSILAANVFILPPLHN